MVVKITSSGETELSKAADIVSAGDGTGVPWTLSIELCSCVTVIVEMEVEMEVAMEVAVVVVVINTEEIGSGKWSSGDVLGRLEDASCIPRVGFVCIDKYATKAPRATMTRFLLSVASTRK